MEKDLISVIVPVYKVEKYLDKCVQSIVNQTYTNLEIILVDDGSPDNCPQMCDDWVKKDNRIKVIHKENGGVSSARNMGIDVAKGNWIVFVDSDDEASKDIVKMLMDNSESLDSLVVCCAAKRKVKLDKYINNVKSKMYSVDTIYQSDLSKIDQTYSANFASPWGKLYNTKMLKDNNIRFSEKIMFGEDYVFNLYYWTKIKNIKTINYKGYFYRLNNESISSKYRSDSYLEKANISKKAFSEEVNYISETYFKNIEKNFHYSDIESYLNQILNITSAEIKKDNSHLINLSRKIEEELYEEETAKNYSSNKVMFVIKNKIFKYSREHSYIKLAKLLHFYSMAKKLKSKF